MTMLNIMMQTLETDGIEILQREWDEKAQVTKDALNTMESQGLATMTFDVRENEDEEGNKNKNKWRIYTITEKGKQWLADLRTVPNEPQK